VTSEFTLHNAGSTLKCNSAHLPCIRTESLLPVTLSYRMRSVQAARFCRFRSDSRPSARSPASNAIQCHLPGVKPESPRAARPGSSSGSGLFSGLAVGQKNNMSKRSPPITARFAYSLKPAKKAEDPIPALGNRLCQLEELRVS
jgi:hypothetical protein